MSITIWNATALTGGTTRSLDAISVGSLSDGDIAITHTGSILYFHRFDASATNAESSPTYIHPNDYSTSGVWKNGTVGEVFGLGTMPSGATARHGVGMVASHGTDAANDLDFSIGAWMDHTNSAVISSTAVITKRVDATWAAGTGAGGNLSNTGTASHLYLWVAMGSGVDGDADIGFYDTADGTSLANRVSAAGFSYYKVLGFRRLTSGAAWAKFIQNGDYLISTIASENIISPSGITTAYATVTDTSLISADYTELVWYGVQHATEDGTDEGVFFSDDAGTSLSGVIGRPAATVTDTDDGVWGATGAVQTGYIPYYASRQFKSKKTSVSLLLHGIKFKR